jgi:hypothetical protein
MALTGLKLAIEMREGRRANIVASGLVDGVA